MPTKYSKEFKEQTAQHVIESDLSAISVAEELGSDVNSVCRWVRDYRRAHQLPTWAEQHGQRPLRRPKTDSDLIYEKHELERELKQKNKELADRAETIEILKKSLAIFTQPLA